MPALSHAEIRSQFATRRREQQARHRDIAEALGLSEGELIAAHVGAPGDGLQARRLQGPWPELVEALEPLGPVMALTRNDSCVHEKTGVYREASHGGAMGLVLGGDIDLRIFYRHWAHGFAITEPVGGGQQDSLQFFDARGLALHKVFARPQTDLAAWQNLAERSAASQQQPGIELAAEALAAGERPDADVDVAAFLDEWAGLRDTHQFFGLLGRHELSRTQALRLAQPRFTQPVPAASARRVLEAAAREGVPVMVFVGSPGVIQIHTGAVQRVAVMGPWLNVLDPGFNLHLREDHIARAWIVDKPTEDGSVTSLELFDAAGRTIAMFFGERKPGRPEREDWRGLIAGVRQEAMTCQA